ncbi:MAG TPA: hypothetical protein VGF17_22800, partial [Phytomonospora sp.]
MTVMDNRTAAAPGKPDRDSDPRNPRLRLQRLVDEGSYEEISAYDRSGMLACTGTVNGARVVAYASDPTV